jgi:hypothetical protein
MSLMSRFSTAKSRPLRINSTLAAAAAASESPSARGCVSDAGARAAGGGRAVPKCPAVITGESR